MVPYRVTIEMAIGEKGKTIQVTGETPLLGDPLVDSILTAMAANALLWQSSAMASVAGSHLQWEVWAKALNLPTQNKVM